VVIADLHDVALLQHDARVDRTTVDLHAVVAAEILDHPRITIGGEPRMAARDVLLGELDRVPVLAADRDRFLAEGHDGRAALVVLDDEA
jgi:hypothetical protein